MGWDRMRWEVGKGARRHSDWEMPERTDLIQTFFFPPQTSLAFASPLRRPMALFPVPLSTSSPLFGVTTPLPLIPEI